MNKVLKMELSEVFKREYFYPLLKQPKKYWKFLQIKKMKKY